MRRVNFLPPAALDGLEETLDVVGYFNCEMFGHRVDEFAPAFAELDDFARDNFLGGGRGL